MLENGFTKILIVDDSPKIRQHLIEMLTADSNGIRVIGTTGRVSEARDLIDQHKPHIITLDLQLEDGNGLDLLRLVKQSSNGETKGFTPKVIVLTNHSGLPFQEKCKLYGADVFLDKATEFEKIRQVVLQLAEGGL
ncbi:MAG: response regulator [Pyrinomonadaceae bacterium]